MLNQLYDIIQFIQSLSSLLIDFMNDELSVFYKYTLSFILNQYFILYFIFLYIMHKSISTYLHI